MTIVACARSAPKHPDVSHLTVGDLSPQFDWSKVLIGVNAVIHLAGRAHIMSDASLNPLVDYRRTNVHGTLNLARQAADAGVKRFIFMSSIKVNGESTQLDIPFTANDIPAPLDAYGISKMEAEYGLQEIAAQTGMEVVIIRPPLVYGIGVKGNFATMMRWLSLGIPLPLNTIYNKRSFVGLDNLVDLVMLCLIHPSAANQIFLVSDDEDVSTNELLYRIGKAMEKQVYFLPIPSSFLQIAASILDKKDEVRRLYLSLQVDIKKTRHLLDWSPTLTLDEGLRKAVKGCRV